MKPTIRRVLGGLLFFWMAAAVIGQVASGDLSKHTGTRWTVEIVILVVLSALALMGLLVAIGSTKKS